MFARVALAGVLFVSLFTGCIQSDKDGTSREVNEAPSAPLISLGPTGAQTADELLVSIVTDSVDPNGDEFTYGYKWLVDGVLRDDLSGSTIPAAETSKGETWSVLVAANDGELESEASESSVLIENTEPVVVLSLENAEPTTTDDLVALVESEDADGDALTMTWSWTVEGAVTNEDEETVAATETTKGEEWEVSLVVSDGDSEVDLESIEVVVLNAVPVVTELLVDPLEAYETSVISASSSTADDDDDAVSVAWSWTVNGTLVADEESHSLDGTHFNKHDSVVAVATPSDEEEAGAAVESTAITVLNTPPGITGVSLDPSELYEASTVTCTPEGWADVDGDAENYLFSWTLDGTAIAETSATLDGATFDKGNEVSCSVIPDDGEELGAEVSSVASVVSNTAPTISAVSLSTLTPGEADTITSTVTGVLDEDGDPVTYQYAWLVDGVFVAATSELSGSSFSKGQQVSVEVSPFDGTDLGVAVTSDTATVQNTAPVLDSATLTPNPVAYSGALSCLPGTVTDIDSDLVTYTYSWLVDGTPVAATTATLDNTYFLAGASVSCSIVPNDGEDDGASVPSNFAVVNNPPSVGNVVISPASPTAADTITCQHDTPVDADADAVSVAYAWTVGGIAATSTGSTLGVAVQRDQTVECVVTPSDAYESGTAVTASTTVVNTPPVVSSVNLSPASPFTDSVVTANAVVNDLDGDTVNLSYAFEVNLGLVQNSSSNALDGAAHFQRGDSVGVTVTPSDSQNMGAQNSDAVAVTVVNSTPGAPGVSVTPVEPTPGVDAITCSVDTPSTDADGDAVSYAFSWTADTSSWTGPQTDTALSSVISASDAASAVSWTCRVTPTDAYGEDGQYAEDTASACEYGSGSVCPGLTCRDILDQGYSTGDGAYWIDPTGNDPFEVFCDMSTDGGGWTLVSVMRDNNSSAENKVPALGMNESNLVADDHSDWASYSKERVNDVFNVYSDSLLRFYVLKRQNGQNGQYYLKKHNYSSFDVFTAIRNISLWGTGNHSGGYYLTYTTNPSSGTPYDVTNHTISHQTGGRANGIMTQFGTFTITVAGTGHTVSMHGIVSDAYDNCEWLYTFHQGDNTTKMFCYGDGTNYAKVWLK